MTRTSASNFSAFVLVAVSLAAGAGAGVLVMAYPLGPMSITLFAVPAALLSAWNPRAGLLLAMAAMPVVDFASWTGWLTFEEFDLLILSVACGAYSGMAFKQLSSGKRRVGAVAILLIAVFAISTIISTWRGVNDAGGFVFGWYQGYYEAMNSVRLGKSYWLALLLVPIWWQCERANSEATVRALATGMGLGLGLASLAALWERLAFTGLLDFSTDYRTTALFWEMHVGGAALDGYLALSIPFAAWLLVSTRIKERWLWFGIGGLAIYASLTTFSRGVYLAVPIGLALMAVLSLRSTTVGELRRRSRGALLPLAVLAGLFGLCAFWVFPGSGYRGMLALLVVSIFAYPVARTLSTMPARRAVAGVAMGGGLALLAALAGMVVPKGAYWVFALGAAMLSAGVLLPGMKRRDGVALPILAGFSIALAGTVMVAFHWGGEAAGVSMGAVVVLLAFVVAVGGRMRLPEISIEGYSALAGVMIACALGIATFCGGAYMGTRFSTAGQDMELRIRHWQNGLAQLQDLDWWLGKGLGRYPATHYFAAPDGEHPGGYRLNEASGNSSLLLYGGKHINGWGEMFRMSQRVIPGVPPYQVNFDVMANKAVQLHFEMCEKHLLYNAACIVREVQIPAQPGAWQKFSADLAGTVPTTGLWYAPVLVAFSVAVETRGGVVTLDNIALRDGAGADLLKNGGFDDGLAHWYSSSDRYHMPWHMKNLFVHVLFDQGLLGLASLLILIFACFFRLTVGKAKGHPLAPVLAGALGSFLVIGAFDSLLDVPRLACLFYLLLLIGLLIKPPCLRQAPPGQHMTDLSIKGT